MKRKIGVLFLVFASCAAMACQTSREVIRASCYQFPEIDEAAIVNDRGDQSQLRNSERFNLYYPYVEIETIDLIGNTADGKLATLSVTRQSPHSHRFNGETIAVVKNIAKNFVRSRKSLECKPEDSAR